MKTKKVILFSFLLLSLFILGCKHSNNITGDTVLESKSGLVIADAEYVCMVNNQLFPKVQIPVEVDGKTYYGCCSMCETTLNTNPSSRSAVDPVSGNTVDKSAAIIGADSSGKTFYFENIENFKNY